MKAPKKPENKRTEKAKSIRKNPFRDVCAFLCVCLTCGILCNYDVN